MKRVLFLLLFLTGYFCALSILPLRAQSSGNNKGKSQQTLKESTDQLKKDFQGLKDAFKKKEKKDSGQATPVGAPVTVPEDLEIATGNYHVLAIKDGVLYGWGDNSEGQLGLGNKTIEYSPVQITPGNDWWQVSAAAMHSLAIKKDSSLWAWGWGNNHEMGLGQANSRAMQPTRVGNSKDWIQVSTAMNNTVGIRKNGTLWVWGNNVNAALGVGATPNSAVYVPTQVGKDTNWAFAIAVEHINLAIKKDGSLWSWGRKGYSDLRGYSTTADVTTTPTRIGADNDWARIFVHRYHGNSAAIAIKRDGSLWAWGNNASGKLGFGDEAARPTPEPMKLKGQWIDFAIGRSYALAIQADGSLWHCGNYLQWADVKAGEQNKSTKFERTKIAGKWTGAYLLQQSGVVLTDNQGNIFAYGINARGEMGSGTKGGSWVPKKITLPPPVSIATTPQPIPANTGQLQEKAQGGTALSPEATLMFAKVKSKLGNKEKNSIAQLTDFVIAKTNKNQFTVKGQPVNEEFPFDITVYPLDVNNDGKEEVVLVWGNTFWCGGAGASSILLGQSATGGMVKLHDSQGFIFLMSAKTQGYHDIFMDVPSPNNKYPIYKWGGKEYKMVSSVTGTDAVWNSIKNMEEISKKYQSAL